MNELLALLGVVVLAAIIVLAIILIRRRPRKLNQKYFDNRWRELQQLLKDKTTWKQAVIEADNLLGEALRRKGVRGKSIGERLVKIQKQLTANDSLWYGHKMRGKIEAEPKMRLKQKEVKDALVGIRQALKDIGALPNGKSSK